MGALATQQRPQARTGRADRGADPADVHIVDGLRSRDEESLERLFEKYGRLIAHWARTEGQDTEDVVQDVLLKAWRYGHRLDPDTHLPAWLKTVTKNTLRNRWRSKDRKPQVPVGLDIDSADADDPITTSDDRLLVNELLEALNPRERECLQKLYVSDMTLSEVADEMGSSPEAMKSLAARARRRIRGELKKMQGAAAGVALPFNGIWEALQGAGAATASKVATTAAVVLTAGALTLAGTADTQAPDATPPAPVVELVNPASQTSPAAADPATIDAEQAGAPDTASTQRSPADTPADGPADTSEGTPEDGPVDRRVERGRHTPQEAVAGEPRVDTGPREEPERGAEDCSSGGNRQEPQEGPPSDGENADPADQSSGNSSSVTVTVDPAPVGGQATPPVTSSPPENDCNGRGASSN